jgi:sugar phosphate isomerase/epimerase
VRLGSPLPRTWDDPAGWIAALERHGFRAACWPLGDDADTDTADAYAAAAAAAGVVIAEIGAWSNPISPDERTRAAALELCKRRLALADRVGARCCVNIAGSRGDVWDGPHPDNLSRDTFALIVDSVREIIDAVEPRRTFYSLEPMPWTLPDSPDSYLELMSAIDRRQFAVHLDPTNLINSPAKFYDNAGLLRECFAKLGPHIKCCHAKDITLAGELPVRLAEAIPGRGALDYRVLLTEMDRLDPDTPLLVEHLADDGGYAAATAHIRSVAEELGVAV